jgi:hypothetical protein
VIEVHWESTGGLQARAERGSKQLGARGLLEHFGIVLIAMVSTDRWRDLIHHLEKIDAPRLVAPVI